MKFIIAIAFLATISIISAQKTASAKTADPIQVAATQLAGYINNFQGTSDALAADLTNKAKNEKGSYTSAQIDSFCKGVCTQLSQNSKITCQAFTSIVKTNLKASN